jgi:hypothetical protein
VYNAFDQSGNPVASSYDQVTATIPSAVPNHPTGLGAVIHGVKLLLRRHRPTAMVLVMGE